MIGILIQPWRLLANAAVYIGKWLVGYSSLLGAVGGVLIADYFVIRRTRLNQAGLYEKTDHIGTPPDSIRWRSSRCWPVSVCACRAFSRTSAKWGSERRKANAALPRIPAFWGDPLQLRLVHQLWDGVCAVRGVDEINGELSTAQSVIGWMCQQPRSAAIF